MPRRADIPHTLRDMQQTVGGYIEIIRPFDDPVVLVCDEEGKLKGYELNRYIAGKDIIAGTFFICGLGAEDFTDLPDDLAEKYERLFRYPQAFARVPNGILMISENGRTEIIR
jgi:hypothetical protein